MAVEPEPVEGKKAARSMDTWKWLQILVIPITTLIVGQYASNWQERESARRTYADMMGRREDAESALRKDMFQTTVQPFLEKKTDNIEASVLRLELLAGNFHDSLDLSPLFKDVYRTLSSEQGDSTGELLKRLTVSAQEVIRREIDTVREAGTVRPGSVQLEALDQGPLDLFGDEVLTLPGGQNNRTERTFHVQVISYDPARNEFLVRLHVWGAGNSPELELQTKPFHVGPFDFPLIDNTRLTGGQRVALSFDGDVSDSGTAQLTLVYFPGSRASLKDKQYYEDMASELFRISSSE